MYVSILLFMQRHRLSMVHKNLDKICSKANLNNCMKVKPHSKKSNIFFCVYVFLYSVCVYIVYELIGQFHDEGLDPHID